MNITFIILSSISGLALCLTACKSDVEMSDSAAVPISSDATTVSLKVTGMT